jgi:hypothetical protein
LALIIAVVFTFAVLLKVRDRSFYGRLSAHPFNSFKSSNRCSRLILDRLSAWLHFDRKGEKSFFVCRRVQDLSLALQMTDTDPLRIATRFGRGEEEA